MADEKTTAAPLTYVEELNLRHQRFIALGGGKDLQMEMKDWTPLKDLVTDLHRKLVFDMASSGLSNADIAEVVGISKDRLQLLFKVELATAYQLCHASLSRSLYWQGISGDGKAATDWLRYHNRSKWAAKTQLSGMDEGPIKVEDTGSKAILAALLGGMATDKSLRGPDKDVPQQETESKPQATSVRSEKFKQIKKVKGDEEPSVDTAGPKAGPRKSKE